MARKTLKLFPEQSPIDLIKFMTLVEECVHPEAKQQFSELCARLQHEKLEDSAVTEDKNPSK